MVTIAPNSQLLDFLQEKSTFQGLRGRLGDQGLKDLQVKLNTRRTRILEASGAVRGVADRRVFAGQLFALRSLEHALYSEDNGIGLIHQILGHSSDTRLQEIVNDEIAEMLYRDEDLQGAREQFTQEINIIFQAQQEHKKQTVIDIANKVLGQTNEVVKRGLSPDVENFNISEEQAQAYNVFINELGELKELITQTDPMQIEQGSKDLILEKYQEIAQTRLASKLPNEPRKLIDKEMQVLKHVIDRYCGFPRSNNLSEIVQSRSEAQVLAVTITPSRSQVSVTEPSSSQTEIGATTELKTSTDVNGIEPLATSIHSNSAEVLATEAGQGLPILNTGTQTGEITPQNTALQSHTQLIMSSGNLALSVATMATLAGLLANTNQPQEAQVQAAAITDTNVDYWDDRTINN